ncbi:hypothetical protein HELRODRAFT_177354 [Helobdella robusta]|uniref:C-type lectin domain-containing protein n=1 Tax=Helobdella robusta TaxID=6412 RepID=T1FBK0_HELRO|nr:hypothetical protein HELRODRAFT_177354 [Helobdella robusta]ESN98116.1 hypothetical protein HELRODRAFT_177354 [Helobdella robusta]
MLIEIYIMLYLAYMKGLVKAVSVKDIDFDVKSLGVPDCYTDLDYCFMFVKRDRRESINNYIDADNYCKKKFGPSFLLEMYDDKMNERMKKIIENKKKYKQSIFPLNMEFHSSPFLYYQLDTFKQPERIIHDKYASLFNETYAYIAIKFNDKGWEMVSEDHTEQHRILCRLPKTAADCSKPLDVKRKKRALSVIKISNVENQLKKQLSYKKIKLLKNVIKLFNKKHNVLSVMAHSLARKPHVLEKVSSEEWKRYGVDYVKLKSSLHGSDPNYILIDAFWFKYSNLDAELLEKILKSESNNKTATKEDKLKKVGINDTLIPMYSEALREIAYLTKKVPFLKRLIAKRGLLDPYMRSILNKNAVSMRRNNVDISKVCMVIEYLGIEIAPELRETLDISEELYTSIKNYYEDVKFMFRQKHLLDDQIKKVCEVVKLIFHPFLTLNWTSVLKGPFWADIINKLDNDGWRGLLKMIYDNKDKALELSMEPALLDRYGLDSNETENIKNVYQILVDGVKSYKFNINTIIALIKKLQTFDWSRLINNTKTKNSYRSLNMKKLGTVILSEQENILKATPEDLYRYDIDPDNYERYKTAISSIKEELTHMVMNFSAVVSTIARGFVKKTCKGVTSRKLNINLEILNNNKNITSFLNFMKFNEDPSKISEDELAKIKMNKDLWNQVSYRIIEEGDYVKGDIEQDKVVYRDNVGSDCMVLYYGVTSWYEAQSFCVKKGGRMMAFKDDQEFALLDKPELRNVPDLSSMWTGATKNFWTWKKNGTSVVWSTFSSFTAPFNSNYVYFQTGNPYAESWFLSNRWEPAAGQQAVMCILPVITASILSTLIFLLVAVIGVLYYKLIYKKKYLQNAAAPGQPTNPKRMSKVVSATTTDKHYLTSVGAQSPICSYHKEHCFYVAQKSEMVSMASIGKADDICNEKQTGGYLLEPYTKSVQAGANKFAEKHAPKQNIFPINAQFTKRRKFMNIKANDNPTDKPTSLSLAEEAQVYNYVYGELGDDNKSWVFHSADHEQYHSIICLFKINNKECTKPLKAAKMVLDTSYLKKYQTGHPKETAKRVKLNRTNFSPKVNETKIEGTIIDNKLEISNENWIEFLDYMGMMTVINVTAFNNNSTLKNMLKELLAFSNKTYEFTEEHLREVSSNVTAFKKLDKLLDFLKPRYRLKPPYRDNLVFKAGFFDGSLFKMAKEKFLSWLKGFDFKKICIYLDMLNDPTKFTCQEANESGVPVGPFRFYKTYLWPPMNALLGYNNIRNLIVTTCYKILDLLAPLLKINWGKLFNNKNLESLKGLDFQFIGEFILESKDHLLMFTEDALKQFGVPEEKIEKYKNGFTKLTEAIKEQDLNLNNLIAKIKNGKIFNWRSLYDPGKSFLENVKNFDFKKIGQIYSSLKDKLDSINVDTLEKYGLEIISKQVKDVKHVFEGFENTIKSYDVKINEMIGKTYGNFTDKFKYIKELKNLGLNIKNELLNKIGDLNVTALKENPFTIADEELVKVDIDRSDWNDLVQRVGDNRNPYEPVDPYKIDYRKTIDDQCLVIYHGSTSWYEGQNICAENDGNLLVFDDKVPLSVMDDKKIFELKDFSSYWIGVTKNIWTWNGKKTPLIWSSFSAFSAFGDHNLAFFQTGKEANSWYIARRWDPEAGKNCVICMTNTLIFILVPTAAMILIAVIIGFVAFKLVLRRKQRERQAEKSLQETVNDLPIGDEN